MPIVINEFEVVAEQPQPPQQPQGQATQQPAEARPLRPEDIVRIERRHYERLKRVQAD